MPDQSKAIVVGASTDFLLLPFNEANLQKKQAVGARRHMIAKARTRI